MHLTEGHPGVNKLYARCRAVYSGISKKVVEEICRECVSCIANEPLKIVTPLENIVATYPMERIQMDIVDLGSYSNVKN